MNQTPEKSILKRFISPKVPGSVELKDMEGDDMENLAVSAKENSTLEINNDTEKFEKCCKSVESENKTPTEATVEIEKPPVEANGDYKCRCKPNTPGVPNWEDFDPLFKLKMTVFVGLIIAFAGWSIIHFTFIMTYS